MSERSTARRPAPPDPGPRRLDLAIVMPVYNEAEGIAGFVQSWRAMLRGLGISFRLLLLDDGSTDGTTEILQRYAHDADMDVRRKPNSGHGPTVMTGYRRAVELADWVFQCDSDGELAADSFPAFWQSRRGHDAVLGVRSVRAWSPARWVLSTGARVAVRLLFGPGVVDVNVPYRLMRAEALSHILGGIPDDTFSPNVLISGALIAAGARVLNLEVPCEPRRTGTASLRNWRIPLTAWMCARQILAYRAAGGRADRCAGSNGR